MKEELKERIQQLVFESIGAASMCWDKTPEGVFQSDRANTIGKNLTEFISYVYQEGYNEGYDQSRIDYNNTGFDPE